MKDTETSLTAGKLRALMTYDPHTGAFTRLVGRGGQPVGRRCGFINGRGYENIVVYGRAYYTHRLAFLYMTGGWPKAEVDHINGIIIDNRWSNLRPATRAQNMRNKAGASGAYRRGRRWFSKIGVDGTDIHLGTFPTEEEARAAYQAAKRLYHGEYARVA